MTEWSGKGFEGRCCPTVSVTRTVIFTVEQDNLIWDAKVQ